MNVEPHLIGNISVLIVEPNAYISSVLKGIMHAQGARLIVEARDGADAFKEMRVFVPDLILTEWDMEPVDGLDFTRLIRTGKESPNPNVPIIMISAAAEKDRVMQALQAGISGFVVKPLTPQYLIDQVRRALEKPGPLLQSSSHKGATKAGGNRQAKGPRLSQAEVDALLAS